MYAILLSLSFLYPEIQAQRLIDNPNKDGWVQRKDAIFMDDNPEVRKVLKRKSMEMKLFDQEEADQFFDNGFGGYLIALQMMRVEQEQQRKPKPKKKID